jgi:hypothetical protein
MYAIRRRLGEEKPFLYYLSGFCYLFVENAVYERAVESVSANDFAPFLWAFVDGDARSTGIHEKLVDHTTLYIMYITSPERGQWKTLTKCTSCAEIIMNPWFLEEIRLA